MNAGITIGQHFIRFVDAQIKVGRYSTASDVVEAGLGLLEAHEAKVAALQDALNAGRQSGDPRPFDGGAFLNRMHTLHG